MKQITKLYRMGKQLRIIHSTKIKDKKEVYEIDFGNYTPDYYVRKEDVSQNRILIDHLSCILYMPTEKYKSDEDKWINYFLEKYKEEYSQFKWYEELEIIEIE